MKKILCMALSLAACACMLAGCSGKTNDDSVNDTASATTTTTQKAATDKTTTTEKAKESRTDKDNSHGNLADDIGEGINDGVDTAESIVDDIL